MVGQIWKDYWSGINWEIYALFHIEIANKGK